VIVGSRIIQLMDKNDDFSPVTGLVRGLREAIDKISGQ
jgi:tryptophan synthase alpha subunit